MDATGIPGARGDRCLIFASEGIVRRAWSFPRAWAELDDESIWALLDKDLPAPLAAPRLERRATGRGDHGDVVTAARVAANTRAFFGAADELGYSEAPLCADDSQMAKVGRSRSQMRIAVANYVSSLKDEGVSPERSIVLVKSAVHQGLEQAPECAEHISKDLVDHAVSWCIDAYYAGGDSAIG